MALPERDAEALGHHAADRFVLGWHALFYGALTLATALALIDVAEGHVPMLAGVAALAVWYWLTVMRQPDRWERPLRMAPYFAGLAAAYVYLTGYDDAFNILVWVMYPQVFSYLGKVWGSVGAVAVTALWGWRLGMIATIPRDPENLLTLIASASVAIFLGVFIWSIAVQSERRQEMIDALDRAHEKLGAASERNEALLAETRRALADRNALFEASAALVSARSPVDVVSAIGAGLDAAIDRVVLARGSGTRARVIAQWRRRREMPPLDEVVAVPAGPLAEKATVWPVEGLDAPFAAPWRRAGCGVLLILALDDPEARLPDVLVLSSATVDAVTDRHVRLLEALGASAKLALENLRLLEQARVAGVVEERDRLAREIHDTLAQGFTSVIVQLEAAEAELDVGGDARVHLARARSTARESLLAARRTVRDLRPDLLDDASLPEALQRTAHRAGERWGFTADALVTGASRPLHPDAEVTLLRVAQEALTNVGKHAHAGRVRLTLSYLEDAAIIDVRDDGSGFDPAPSTANGHDPSRGGFGLRAMRERVEALGGQLLIESGTGQGTAVVATVPVARRDDEAGRGS